MIDVEVTGAAIPRFPRSGIAAFATEVLRAAARLRLPGAREVTAVTIAFVDDREMTSLNSRFRNKRKTTDVLTFPADDSFSEPGSRYLGDIVIATPQARRQAGEQRHSLATEIRYLILHGILHALGFDHETDDGEMNALELKLRARVGLS